MFSAQSIEVLLREEQQGRKKRDYCWKGEFCGHFHRVRECFRPGPYFFQFKLVRMIQKVSYHAGADRNFLSYLGGYQGLGRLR